MIIGQLHHLGHSQATVLIPADVLAYGIPRDAKNIGNASHSYSHCIATENIFYFCHKFVVLVSPSARTETKTTKKIPCQNNSGRGQFYSDFCGSLFCDEKGQQTTAVEGLARAIFPQASADGYYVNDYYNNDVLSYQRALALHRFWKEEASIDFSNMDKCELVISGSGEGGVPRFSEEDYKQSSEYTVGKSIKKKDVEKYNQRFLIHIVPVIGNIKMND